MNIVNQKPAILSPVYQAKITGDFDPVPLIKETLCDPLRQPMVQGTPVSILSSKNTPVTDDDIVGQVIRCCGEVMDSVSETWCKELFGQGLAYFDKNTHLAVSELFAIQSAVRAKLPAPTSTVIYTPATDVIPTSREFLAGQCDYDKFMAVMAFYTRAHTLGFYFANETAFDAFKSYLQNLTAGFAAQIPAEVNQLLSDFQANISLSGLTESLLLRQKDGDNDEEYSFPRILVSALMGYTLQTSNAEFGVLPFALGELYSPRTVVFVNVEKHARASAKQVADEWAIVNQSLSMQVRMVSQNKLTRLTATARHLQHIKGMAANAATNSGAPVGKAANLKFMAQPPTAGTLIRWIRKISSKMAVVARSENSYKSVKMTFAKPNRRDPDDFNKQGKMVSTKYRPDIHIYLDTSGSISEENYQDAIMACIKLAKALDVNMYFNSFSHVMSQCHKLTLKGKSTRQIWEKFKRIPKVNGGTDFEQIWHYINRSKRRQRELSLLITDFEWTARPQFVRHPRNLYYAPVSHTNWDWLVRAAEEFVASAAHNDPDIRAHILT